MGKITRLDTKLKDAFLFVPEAFEDERGFFKESFRVTEYEKLGLTVPLVQDNISRSAKRVLRGLHYDFNVTKLVQVVFGRTFHVIADMRPDSPTYCQWQSFILSHENHKQVLVPAGFANGFYVLSDEAFVYYKQGGYFNAQTERLLRWNDPVVGIRWPDPDPIVSEKDRDAPDYKR